MSIEQRLADLGVNLSAPPAPAANYAPYVVTGQHIYISGQLPFAPDGSLPKGKIGADLRLEDGQAAAKACALALIAQMHASLSGEWDRFSRVVKLVGFVNAVPDFLDHPKVINAASDLMAEAFGDAGKHARSAVGAGSLPFGVPVEIEAIVECKL